MLVIFSTVSAHKAEESTLVGCNYAPEYVRSNHSSDGVSDLEA